MWVHYPGVSSAWVHPLLVLVRRMMVPRKYNVGFLVGGSLQHCSGGFYPNVVLLLRVPPPGGGHIPPGVLFTGRRHLWMFVSPPRVVSPVEYWGVP